MINKNAKRSSKVLGFLTCLRVSNGSNDSDDCISINRTARVERKCRKRAKAIFKHALPGQVNKWQQVLTLSKVREGLSRTGHTLTNALLKTTCSFAIWV